MTQRKPTQPDLFDGAEPDAWTIVLEHREKRVTLRYADRQALLTLGGAEFTKGVPGPLAAFQWALAEMERLTI